MKKFSEEKAQKRNAASWLRAQAKTAKKYILGTVFIGVGSGVLLIFQMYCLAHIAYESYILELTQQSLIYYFLTMVFIIILRAILAWVRERVSFQASAAIRLAIREKIYQHVRKLGPVGIAKYNTGAIVSSAVEQTEALHNYFVKYLPQMSIAVFLPLAILVFIFPISITSGILLLICAPLIPLFMALVGLGAESLHQKNFEEISKMSQFFLDTLQGLFTLKLLGKSKNHRQNVFEASDNYRKKTMGVLRIAFLSSAVLEVFAAASIALLAIYLGMGFINNGTGNEIWWGLKDITLQGALFILLLAPEFFLPLRELGTYYHSKAEAVGAAIEIQKLFDKDQLQTIIENDQDNKIFFAKQDLIDITFQEVDYWYLGAKNKAVSNISFQINSGQKIAIVGESGSGKTTLINLLLKFIQASSGAILVNGVDLKMISEEDWYSNVSWLGQNPMLFSGTIKDNLLIANRNATDEMLWKILDQTNLSETIKQLPNQLNTKIGENSLGISGGQAQRLALARAYLKKTPLLLLDEPTASLDIENEQIITDAIERNWHNKTVILSTHRASSLQKMDKILVLDNGRLNASWPI